VMRMPRAMSMKRRSEFARVRKEGRSVAGRFMVLAAMADPELEGLKTGLITSRKVGNAVTRNRVRRRLRAILSRHGERVPSRHYVVVVARVRAGKADFHELEDEWLHLARRLGILEAAHERGNSSRDPRVSTDGGAGAEDAGGPGGGMPV